MSRAVSPLEKITDDDGRPGVAWSPEPGDSYLLCGTDRAGRRFRMESKSWHGVAHINAWRGRWYLVRDGRRFLLRRCDNA